ncbi:MAG TPA: DUF2500 domain-containing protein [Herpetosiphonaceae bacterium]
MNLTAVPGFSVIVFFGAVVFLLIAGQGIAEQRAISRLPILRESARVVTKRANTSSAGGDSRVNTTYYVTFELESGERREFRVEGRDYGLLDDDDRGVLTTQGPRYFGFQRNQA